MGPALKGSLGAHNGISPSRTLRSLLKTLFPGAELYCLGVWPWNLHHRQAPQETLRNPPEDGRGWGLSGQLAVCPCHPREAMPSFSLSQHSLPFLCTLLCTAFSCSLSLFLEIHGRGGDCRRTSSRLWPQWICRGHRGAFPACAFTLLPLLLPLLLFLILWRPGFS